MKTRIAVLGAGGRMGRAIVRAIVDSTAGTLTAAVEAAGSPVLGQDAGELAGVGRLDVAVGTGLPAAGQADVWIDFTAPGATMAAVQAAQAAGAAMVVGTTGLDAAQRARVAAAATQIPVVMAPNMSVGINVLLKIVADTARALGAGYDLEVVEIHHRAKRDAPSGTAIRLAEALAAATGRDLNAVGRFERHGDVGPRTDAEIGVQALRGGDVVGDHTVYFLGHGERIEITHRASSRDTLAIGAVRAALWLASRAPGLYDMEDVLGL